MEIRYYHLEQASLESVLPVMLERCLERGSRAIVRARSTAARWSASVRLSINWNPASSSEP